MDHSTWYIQEDVPLPWNCDFLRDGLRKSLLFLSICSAEEVSYDSFCCVRICVYVYVDLLSIHVSLNSYARTCL